MAVDLEAFAFSFSHAIIKIDDTQFTAISNITFDQGVERSGVFGTAASPLKKSRGQLALGEGTITFSDLEEGQSFIASLSPNASAAVFTVDVTFSNEADDTRGFELLGCSLSGFGGNFEQGADAMGVEIPFDFLKMKIDGAEFSTD